MIRLLARWLGTSALLLFVVSALTFVLTALAPGDAARVILGKNGTDEQYQALRAQLGLDDPLPLRYWHWLSGALHGDLGVSIYSQQSVTDMISGRLAPTLALVVGGLLFSAVLGIALGIASARSRGALSRATDVLSLLGVSIPTFWLGFILVIAFAVALPVFPATGYVDFASSPSEWARSLVLPVVTLGVGGVALIAKQTRDAMSKQLSLEYVNAMRAQGLSERSIVYRHVLKNAAVPIATVLGLLFTGLFSGTVIVENVFALPGLGGLVVQATVSHDIPVVEGVALVFALVVVLTNLVVDLSYGLLNPRTRMS
ncbi:peptide/nickel transport system permease protein [Plantibacter sp. VKM Ac-1784]|uniref:Peptide/nickel transport system permease protein n=1 Tax=Plantibacter elymi (nom. nud.) TaxID=199708 RepID=A0ABY1REE1_9MICO|nr:ABC transporter permease [Plantibacter sp. VKM Ac-1784]SMQ71184.1 peptide/nickel transport system permease protein [Plantibacter sp. VKM Ac-1784]